MEICCFPQSISTYFYKFQSISIILSPYHSYLLILFLTLLIYSLNGCRFWKIDLQIVEGVEDDEKMDGRSGSGECGFGVGTGGCIC
ncbi:MAG: hypothetical protein AB1414_21180 [bacterium]